jgi:hypothetical protein
MREREIEGERERERERGEKENKIMKPIKNYLKGGKEDKKE